MLNKHEYQENNEKHIISESALAFQIIPFFLIFIKK